MNTSVTEHINIAIKMFCIFTAYGILYTNTHPFVVHVIEQFYNVTHSDFLITCSLQHTLYLFKDERVNTSVTEHIINTVFVKNMLSNCEGSIQQNC